MCILKTALLLETAPTRVKIQHVSLTWVFQERDNLVAHTLWSSPQKDLLTVWRCHAGRQIPAGPYMDVFSSASTDAQIDKTDSRWVIDVVLQFQMGCASTTADSQLQYVTATVKPTISSKSTASLLLVDCWSRPLNHNYEIPQLAEVS